MVEPAGETAETSTLSSFDAGHVLGRPRRDDLARHDRGVDRRHVEVDRGQRVTAEGGVIRGRLVKGQLRGAGIVDDDAAAAEVERIGIGA